MKERVIKKEWIIRILKTLEKEEYDQVLKKAKLMGAKVNSFRDITKLPPATLYGALNSNKGNKASISQTIELVFCIGEAIIAQSEDVLEKDKDNKQADLRTKIAEYVLHKGTMSEESIQNALEELEERVEQQKNESKAHKPASQQVSFVKDENYAKRIPELEKQIADLTEMVEKAKEKNQKLDIKIQKLNQENEDKSKSIRNLEKSLNSMKGYQDQEKEYTKLQEEFEKLKEEHRYLSKMMEERESELAIANEQLLRSQEENSRKVLCFTKGKLATNHFPGYHIQSVANFEINHLIHWEDYDDIWVITKDFSYATIREIKQASQKKVQTFYSHKVIGAV